jgi:hypothetical protein
VIEQIEETTVGMLGNARVPMASMTIGSYTLPNGSPAHGWICYLAGAAGGVFVGVGSEVTVDGQRWQVIAVEKTPPNLGSVSLQAL